MTLLRRLNPAGLEQFQAWLDDHRGSTTASPPLHLLDGLDWTEVVPGGCELNPSERFETKREAAQVLHALLDPLRLPDVHADAGLWSWLALLWFDNLTITTEGGARKVLAHAHYVYDPRNSKRRYRHLLHTPFQLLAELPDSNRLFLDSDVQIHGELIEQTMGRLYLMRLPGVRAAIDHLYFDDSTGRVKRGAMSSGKPKRGDLRRLAVRIRQLMRTYDLAALDGERLVVLLGHEFRGWR